MTALFSKRDGYWTVPQLILFTVGQLVVLLALVTLWQPTFLANQLGSGWARLLGAFVGINVLHAFAEWFIHRYVLHLASLRIIALVTAAHRLHHRLTDVAIEDGRLRSDYPITRREQREAGTFPVYTFWIWFALLTPTIYLPLQWLLPNWPLLLAGWLAMTWGHCLYEGWHAVEHLDYQRWWAPLIAQPGLGPVATKLYAFHLVHHLTPTANEAIGGFFLLPLADLVFGTYLPTVVLPGQPIDYGQALAPTPHFAWIRHLDRWARQRDQQLNQAPNPH